MHSTLDTEAIRVLLNSDPVWSAYALADLQPRFAGDCQWFPIRTRSSAGVVLLFTGLTPPVLLTVGDPDAVAMALQQASLPSTVYISARPEHLPPILAHYTFDNLLPMLRMNLPVNETPAARSYPDGQGEKSLVRLGPGDAPRIERLFAHGGEYTPDAFDPYQLQDGLFFAIPDSTGELEAVGGTHIVDWTSGIAAIGNMYTRPDCRGRGHGAAILQAIVSELQARSAATIVLNVNQHNSGARRLYERQGFVVHCSFYEGIGAKRSVQA